MPDPDPGQDQKPGVIGNKMNMVLAFILRPSDEPVATADMTRRRRPGKTGNGPFPGIDHILELFSHRLAIAQIMVLFDKAVEDLFIGGAPHLTKCERP